MSETQELILDCQRRLIAVKARFAEATSYDPPDDEVPDEVGYQLDALASKLTELEERVERVFEELEATSS